ncbi:endonuclease 4-like [Cynara cardunculus var. scolymus]|uniref:endonuclease 4-like n=1 Tax=Cynara cardunculus var. scolymus TaxID=59895 RepID=UPI000D623312|nr:endonuclease 4-like [Cynara cardunculus var. scolymus]XP_024983986.1 endonuclease 4-like [Cynara cardunculus var. scolymus]
MTGFKLWWIKGTFATLMLLIPGNLAWGKEGHYATCKIAESFLTEEALKAVKDLLPETAEGDLASVCSWPDEIKHRYNWRWTSELHYVDTPDFRCNYDYCRDCHDSSGVKDRCVTGAIYNYTEQLVMGYNTSNSVKYNLTEALMFLSHYIGDVHQPLHVSFTSDEGGNTITVRWYKRKTNLHHVWDTDIIESAMKTFYDKDIDVMILAIEKNITDTWSNDISSWANCTSGQEVCPDPWASESIKCSCNYAYRNATPGSTLGDDYFLSRLPIVEMRLAQAGVRLAATLNRIFDPLYSIPQKLAYIGNNQATSHTV